MKKLLFISLIFVSLMIGCGTENTPVYNLSITVSPQEGGSVATNPNQDVATKGTAFTSTATPNYGYSFVGWKGDITSTENPLKFNLESNTSVIAEFALKTYPLNITIVGNGNVTEQIIQNKATDYEHGTNVQIQAIPDDGWSFVGWTGDITATMDTKTLTINSEKNITANFEPKFYLAENGITVMCPNAETNETGNINGVEYTKRVMLKYITASNAESTCFDSRDNMSWGYSSYWDNIDKSFNSPVNHWDVKGVGGMRYLFWGFNDFNQPLNAWDVSAVSDFTGFFNTATNFNQDISMWNLSSAKVLDQMFYGATSFNQNIGDWDVSNVESMHNLFGYATSFNKDISNWDVSSVTLMSYMFEGAIFNQNIGDWDVSNVERFSAMFADNSMFNQDIGDWNVSSAIDMGAMFKDATSFNQDIGDWDVSAVTDMNMMFEGATNFNQDLSGWCVTNITSEPYNFAANSGLNEENKPKWGTCPGG